nr:MAG TPA: hypothetical protein [Caudoviricetes sp.]
MSDLFHIQTMLFEEYLIFQRFPIEIIRLIF